MHTGLLFDDKLQCPWHSASFSVVDGSLESAPANEGLPTYNIEERNGKYINI